MYILIVYLNLLHCVGENASSMCERC